VAEPAPLPVLQNLSSIGVGTTSDAGNPLAVAGAATLFSHAGGGHQIKVNKAAPAQTASLLFQQGFSGRGFPAGPKWGWPGRMTSASRSARMGRGS
jgi:hypothetical protein